MEKEKKSFLQGESFQDVDPRFAETRLLPLLNDLCDLILENIKRGTYVTELLDFGDAFVIKDDFRKSLIIRTLWEFSDSTKDAEDIKTKFKSAFLNSSASTATLQDESLRMEDRLLENIERIKQMRENKTKPKNTENREFQFENLKPEVLSPEFAKERLPKLLDRISELLPFAEIYPRVAQELFHVVTSFDDGILKDQRQYKFWQAFQEHRIFIQAPPGPSVRKINREEFEKELRDTFMNSDTPADVLYNELLSLEEFLNKEIGKAQEKIKENSRKQEERIKGKEKKKSNHIFDAYKK